MNKRLRKKLARRCHFEKYRTFKDFIARYGAINAAVSPSAWRYRHGHIICRLERQGRDD